MRYPRCPGSKHSPCSSRLAGPCQDLATDPSAIEAIAKMIADKQKQTAAASTPAPASETGPTTPQPPPPAPFAAGRCATKTTRRRRPLQHQLQHPRYIPIQLPQQVLLQLRRPCRLGKSTVRHTKPSGKCFHDFAKRMSTLMSFDPLLSHTLSTYICRESPSFFLLLRSGLRHSELAHSFPQQGREEPSRQLPLQSSCRLDAPWIYWFGWLLLTETGKACTIQATGWHWKPSYGSPDSKKRSSETKDRV